MEDADSKENLSSTGGVCTTVVIEDQGGPRVSRVSTGDESKQFKKKPNKYNNS